MFVFCRPAVFYSRVTYYSSALLLNPHPFCNLSNLNVFYTLIASSKQKEIELSTNKNAIETDNPLQDFGFSRAVGLTPTIFSQFRSTIKFSLRVANYKKLEQKLVD